MSALEAVLPDTWPRPRGFTHGVVAPGARTLHVAGQLGRDRTNRDKVVVGFQRQWDMSLRNVAEVLRAGGADGSSVVAMRIYVTDIDDYLKAGKDELRRAWEQHIGTWYPAITLVEVSRLLHEDAVVEIEATAILDG